MGPVAPGAATPLLVLGHGLWSDARVFRAMVRDMRNPARVLSLDFPGHGTRAGEPPVQSMEALALEYLDAIPGGRGPVVLGGISMGAVAAIHAALLRPDAVAGLLLFAGTAAAEPPHRRLLYRTLAHMYPHWGATAPIRWAVVRTAFDPTFDLDAGAARRTIRWAEGVPRGSVAASLRLMADRPPVLHRLDRITVPVAVVAGENDRVFPPVHARELAARLPNASLHLLPDTGHGIVVERPAAAARLTDQLLARTFNWTPVPLVVGGGRPALGMEVAATFPALHLHRSGRSQTPEAWAPVPDPG